MKTMKTIYLLAIIVAGSITGFAQEANSEFSDATNTIKKQLDESVLDLNLLRQVVAAEKVPLSKKLSDLEAELARVRREYQQTTRVLDTRTLDLSNLRSEIKSRKEEATYLSNLLSEYIRNFESRLHIAEIQEYSNDLDAAKLASENSTLSEQELYEAQAKMLDVSLDRLFDSLGGKKYQGTAVDPSGNVQLGTFVQIGPAAIFTSEDGTVTGTVEQRIGSLEPTIIPFANLDNTNAAAQVINESQGLFTFDPTLGNAHKIEETKDTFIDHAKKGGPVMYPIVGLAGAAMLVALIKWLSMLFVRIPSQKRIKHLLKAMAAHDESEIKKKARKIKGPVGKMLNAGIANLHEPRELIEEIMYENVLTTRLKLDRWLPFIAISAASAPLLGLLGTVTGIINTFKLITVFGSGDVKMLSGGISEALITTEFGLIVAIPSLLFHAFLSRKARGVVNHMEKAAVAFINQIGKTPFNKQEIARNATIETATDAPQTHTPSIPEPQFQLTADMAGTAMNKQVFSVCSKDTVADAVQKIRNADIKDDINTICIVDEHGKYNGQVLLRNLLTQPEQTRVESITDKKAQSVRIDTHLDKVESLFAAEKNVNHMPVVDLDGQLVGCVTRNGDNFAK